MIASPDVCTQQQAAAEARERGGAVAGSLRPLCAARLAGAFLLPVPTMAWLGSVLIAGAIGLAMVVGGVAAEPMRKMIDAEAGAA